MIGTGKSDWLFDFFFFKIRIDSQEVTNIVRKGPECLSPASSAVASEVSTVH